MGSSFAGCDGEGSPVETESVEISGQYPVDNSAPRRARGLLDEVQDVLDDGLVESATLVVSELVTNCVRHGGQDGHISVVLQQDGESLCIRVSSPSAPAKPHLVRFGDRLAGDGGIGLRIVDRLANDWGIHVEESQTIVWVELPTQS